MIETRVLFVIVGNAYNIENLRDDEAKLLYTQIRGEPRQNKHRHHTSPRDR